MALTGIVGGPSPPTQNFAGGVFGSNAYDSTVGNLADNLVLVGRAGDGLLLVALSQGVNGDFDGLTFTPPGGSVWSPDLLSDALPVVDQGGTTVLRAWLWQLEMTQAFINETDAPGSGTLAFTTSTALTDGMLVAGVFQADDGDAVAAVVETGEDARTTSSFDLSVAPSDPSELFVAVAYATASGAFAWQWLGGLTALWNDDFGVQSVIGVADQVSGTVTLDVTNETTVTLTGLHYWTLKQVALGQPHALPARPLVGVRTLPYEVRDDMLTVEERQLLRGF